MPLCFDLDGTLGRFSGGFVLLREALGDLWGGVPTEAELQACSGSTDWEIVDELHRLRFGTSLSESDYARFAALCLRRFESAFHPEGRPTVAFSGLVEGLHTLHARGHRVWIVSGNTPATLTFKARALGIAPHIPLLGSLPGLSRAGLIRHALARGPAPHLYVGDRPHDHAAAQEAGVPFLAVGDAVPGDHPVLSPETEAQHLCAAVEQLLKGPPQSHQ